MPETIWQSNWVFERETISFSNDKKWNHHFGSKINWKKCGIGKKGSENDSFEGWYCGKNALGNALKLTDG